MPRKSFFVCYKGGNHLKVIKNINNNISICIDDNGRELIAFGKGIGFIKPPYEISLSQINRTFYNVKDFDYGILKEIPTEVINVAIRIIDHASVTLDTVFKASTILALADHIHFAIKRKDLHISLDTPMFEDMRQLYPCEVKEANYAFQIINKELKCDLPKSEIPTLALHLINGKSLTEKDVRFDSSQIIDEAIDIIENHFSITIDRNNFNCSRFVTHFDHLIRRCLNNEQITSKNINIYKLTIDKYENVYKVAMKIGRLLRIKLNITLTDEEILYLILHINRLCVREENK